jgi:serine/threonine-protein kinase
VSPHTFVSLPKEGDTLLGKYVLEKPLGKGGMGVVYAARHDMLAQRVAVKFLLPEIANADAVARFVNEARAAARIESDHVARVLDVGMLQDAVPYMVLELLEGSDLSELLQRSGPLPVSDVADYLLQTIDALACAHALGIVHRDLKPSNLFLARRKDGTARVKVLDFGISKIIGQPGAAGGDITRTNAMLGSPLYMSPEQLRDSKSVDHRCDIWALGVIAYQLLTGEPPFMADNAVALFAAIAETEPMRPSARRAAIPPGLEGAVLGCLRRNPNERFASVTELGAALAPFASEAGHRAFESAKRTIPLRAMAVAAMPPAPTPAAPMHVVSTLPTAQSNTADPWASSRAPVTTQTGSKGPGVAIAVVGLAAVAFVGLLVFVGPRVFRKLGAPAAAASIVDAPAASTAQLALAPSSSASSASASTTPSAPASASALASASASATAPSSATAAASIARTPNVPAARPKASASAAAPPTSAAPPKAANCDPPFTINSEGHHVLKPECQ